MSTHLTWDSVIDQLAGRLILTLRYIPDKRLAPNGRKKLHHMTESRLTKPWRQLGREVGEACGWSSPAEFELTETIHWHTDDIDRCPDNDAVPSMLKPIIDGLVDAKVIRNDSQRWCKRLTIEQSRGASTPTHITLVITQRERLRANRSKRPRREVPDHLD